jgi:hypothetical protein
MILKNIWVAMMIEHESDLYEPVKKLFEDNGYTVKGEVRGCDVAAVKGEELVLCELKKSFNLKLVYQLMERKKLAPTVYAVIPTPKSFRAKHTKSMLELLKKLGAGLVTVSPETGIAQIVLAPGDNSENPTKKRVRTRKKIAEEVCARFADNTGGINKTELMTLYKENSLAALCYIESNEILKTRVIKKEIVNVIRSNHYEWFERIGRGEYIMTDKGRAALSEEKYKTVTDYYRNEVNEKCLK